MILTLVPALLCAAECATPVVSGFSLGEAAAPLRTTFNVPYLAGVVTFLPAQNVFACRYLDWTCSNASMCPQGSAVYDRMTDGARNALKERGYIAVSPDVGEVLPSIPHPPSPYLAVLGPRIMLDIWGHHEGTYAGDAEMLKELKDNGVDHIAIIQHVWQRYGYDVKLPDHIPADPRYGGEEGMRAFGAAANECGYIWSLHENYIDLYPDAPSYDPGARVLLADGRPSPAWYNAGTKVQSFGLKCNRALAYAQRNSPEIHRRYGTTAAYLDVHTCVPPWHQLDHEAGQPMSAMARAKVAFDTELFQFERDTHGGPLFGEGGKITGIACEKPAPGRAPPHAAPEADFGAHRNPEGTWIDFGTVATDGAVKVNREAGRLVIFPYPRGKKFRVSVKLAPQADASRIRVRALAARTLEDLGPADFTLENGRLVLTAGKPGAGRYVVTW